MSMHNSTLIMQHSSIENEELLQHCMLTEAKTQRRLVQNADLLNEVGIWWWEVNYEQQVEAEKRKMRGRRHPLLQLQLNCLVSLERERENEKAKWEV